MFGCETGGGIGFGHLLEASNANALATKLKENIDLAIVAADAVPDDDLAKALNTAPASVLDLHTAIKGITDLLKTEFISVLDLEPPQALEGDND